MIKGIEPTEARLRALGFDSAASMGSRSFARNPLLRHAFDAVYTSDHGSETDPLPKPAAPLLDTQGPITVTKPT
jgi:hypothetical protein